MPISAEHPTPYPEVNVLLQELLESVQAVLGSRFVGMYLDGSLASGDFDEDSDIDFIVVVADDEISNEHFLALQAMHDRIAAIESVWAVQLEGSYVPVCALERHDVTLGSYPNIERGQGERLKLVLHDQAWLVHWYVLRERGIVLAGPSPQSFVAPVTPEHLRRAMRSLLSGWVAQLFHEPAQIRNRGYQSYVILSLCRILYTLERGTVVSKPVAARWAQETLAVRWSPLIERAWAGRHEPGSKASSDDMNETVEFIRYTLERSRRFELPVDKV